MLTFCFPYLALGNMKAPHRAFLNDLCLPAFEDADVELPERRILPFADGRYPPSGLDDIALLADKRLRRRGAAVLRQPFQGDVEDECGLDSL